MPETGHAIPPKPQPPKVEIMLDPARIAALQNDSERVSAILGGIFNTPDEIAEPVVVELEPTTQESGLLGLDPDHSSLLLMLLTRRHWTRAELEELAIDRGMMIDGTLERINEASFEAYDQPILGNASANSI